MRLLFAIALCLVSWAVSAQTQKSVSGTFNNSTFPQFVNTIEQQTGYHFYYKKQDIDSLRITLTVQDEALNTVLDKVFDGSALQYSFFENDVYVTNLRQLMTTLPEDYFNKGVTTTRTTPAFDYSAFEKRDRENKIAEERVYVLGPKTSDMTGRATITGQVSDVKNGEAMIGAAVYIEKPTIGVATDAFGRYSLTLPKGRHEIFIKSVGMKLTRRQVLLYGNGKLDIEIEEDILPLKEVVIESEKDVKVTGMKMGAEKLDIKVMKNIPLALGETDIMKVVLTLPGVQSVGEGTVGLNVRGGATSQNLILMNDAVVYNPSHMFGFFSTFNPDVMKSVELYKSGITADYGGRLSSVLDVAVREGNLKKFSGSGGISPITGRLMVEGPIMKEKASFLIGARSTYSDWILGRLNDPGLQNSKASFYDLTANIGYKINDKNKLMVNGYLSRDQFNLSTDTTYMYSDRNLSVRWEHSFNSKLFGKFTGTASSYQYNITSELNPVTAFTMDYAVKQVNSKADFTYFYNSRHTITAGIGTTRYALQPGSKLPIGAFSQVEPLQLQAEQALESALYIGNNFEITPKTAIYAGIRFSFFQNFGPKDVYQYLSGEPLQTETVSDTLRYARGKSVANYAGPEPRISIRHILPKNSSVKLSYNMLRQYIQMLSNTTAITPTDIWKLSDRYVKPQIGSQISLGYYKNSRANEIETSVETYYKWSKNVADYKNGAVLLLNPNLETDVLGAKGKAYGVEVMIKKSQGRANGWISYTWSRSFLQTIGEFESETINKGTWYPSSFDKPHAVNLIFNYKVSRRLNFSLNTVYSTGRPITIPIAKYEINGVERVYYSDRNQYRIPDYFRMDASINIEGNHKIKKLAHSSWTFAIYNLTGRNNPYSVFFTSRDGAIKGYQLSIFAQPIPTVTYNFKF